MCHLWFKGVAGGAGERYGPDFDVVRYRFDRSKKELEGLIFEFTPNAISILCVQIGGSG